MFHVKSIPVEVATRMVEVATRLLPITMVDLDTKQLLIPQLALIGNLTYLSVHFSVEIL